jgi:hypothetical protein
VGADASGEVGIARRDQDNDQGGPWLPQHDTVVHGVERGMMGEKVENNEGGDRDRDGP